MNGWLYHSPFIYPSHSHLLSRHSPGKAMPSFHAHISFLLPAPPSEPMGLHLHHANALSYRFLFPCKASNTSLVLEETHSFWFNSPRLALIALPCCAERPPVATALRMGRGGRGWGGSPGELLSGEWISRRPMGRRKSGFSERAAPDPPLVVTFTIELGQEHVSGGCAASLVPALSVWSCSSLSSDT